jgi:SAM-dependent methyltransferase
MGTAKAGPGRPCRKRRGRPKPRNSCELTPETPGELRNPDYLGQQWLAAQVAPGRVTAIDFAPEMVARAGVKGIDADFACLDVCRDRLDGDCYDVILCFHSFPHFRDQPAALSNFARALKPAGRLIVMHLAGSAHINGFHAGLDGPVNGDILPVGQAWKPLLKAAGLRQTCLVDREHLFFLDAVCDGRCADES